MSASKRILIVAGEASGDRHAAGLMLEAKAADPSLVFVGIGGAEMRAAGLQPIFDAESIAVVGFLEVIRHLPRLRRAFGACVRVLREGVSAVVLVDYPGFNLRLASRARAMGARVLYFISPQVWAWKPGRIERIARDVDRLLVVFPFEVDLYRGKEIEVEYVGHPLVDAPTPGGSREEIARRVGVDPARMVVGLLPGSRLSEVRRNLPPALAAARRLRRFFRDLQFVLPAASTVRLEDVAALLTPYADLEVVLSRAPFYDVLALCRAAIVSSGTATLESALMEVPLVVIYRLNPLTALAARKMTTLDTFGLVNIVAGRRIVPECIQENCTPDRIATEVERFLSDPAHHAATVAALREVRRQLGEGGAYRKAAASLIRFLGDRGNRPAPPGGEPASR